MNIKLKHIALLLLLAFVWGSSFAAIKVSVTSFSAIQVSFIRVFIATIIVGLVAYYSGISYPKKLKNWSILFLIAVFSSVLPFSLIAWASTETASAVISILMATSPLFALACAHLFSKNDTFNLYKLSSVILGFTGVLVMFLPAITQLESQNLWAMLATLFSALCYVVAGILPSRLSEQIGTPSMTFIIMLFSTLALLPFVILQGTEILGTLSIDSLLAILYLGIFSTAFAHLIRYRLILEVGYTFVSYAGFLIPIFATFFGAVLLQEKLSMNAYVSLFLVLSALSLSRRSHSKNK